MSEDLQNQLATERGRADYAWRNVAILEKAYQAERKKREELQAEAPAATVRRVVCAAIRAEDGDVLLGVRHYSTDMHAQIHARRDGAKFCHRGGDDQGFVDQHGQYMTREEAYFVAGKADQIINIDACSGRTQLFSEALY